MVPENTVQPTPTLPEISQHLDGVIFGSADALATAPQNASPFSPGVPVHTGGLVGSSGGDQVKPGTFALEEISQQPLAEVVSVGQGWPSQSGASGSASEPVSFVLFLSSEQNVGE